MWLIIIILAFLLFWYIHQQSLKEGYSTSPGTTVGYNNMHYPYMYWRGYPYDHAKQNPWWFWRQRYPHLRRWYR